MDAGEVRRVEWFAKSALRALITRTWKFNKSSANSVCSPAKLNYSLPVFHIFLGGDGCVSIPPQSPRDK